MGVIKGGTRSLDYSSYGGCGTERLLCPQHSGPIYVADPKHFGNLPSHVLYAHGTRLEHITKGTSMPDLNLRVP